MSIVVVGGSNMDITGQSFVPLVAKDSNPGSIAFSFGGVGRNICENIQRLGYPTTLLTILGKDFNGKSISEYMSALKVNLSHIKYSEDFATSCYLSINNNDGDMSIAVSGMEILEQLDVDYLKDCEAVLQAAEGIVVDTNPPLESLCYLLKTFGGDKRIYVDAVSTAKAAKLIDLLPYIYLLKTNRYEAELLTGESDPELACRKLAAMGVTIPLVTLGSKGAMYGMDDTIHFVETVPAKVINASGAGDAFMAGIAMALTKGYSIEESAQIGAAAAALTVCSADTVSKEMSLDKLNCMLKC